MWFFIKDFNIAFYAIKRLTKSGEWKLIHNLIINYSVSVFFVVLISASVLNLLRQHFIFQVTGIAFLFMFMIIKVSMLLNSNSNILLADLYYSILPILSSIGACLVAMALGFWIFPPIRRVLKVKKGI